MSKLDSLWREFMYYLNSLWSEKLPECLAKGTTRESVNGTKSPPPRAAGPPRDYS